MEKIFFSHLWRIMINAFAEVGQVSMRLGMCGFVKARPPFANLTEKAEIVSAGTVSPFSHMKQHSLLLPCLAAISILLAANFAICAEKSAGRPQRIVSLSPAITEQIFILGAQDRLVGCTIYCTKPAEAEKKEKIGTVLEINLEKLVELAPDLVIGSSLTKQGTVGKLKELGFKVVIFNSPKDFKILFKQFMELGELIGEKEKAVAIASESEKKMNRIKTLVSALADKPKVLFQIGASPMYVAGNDSFVGDFIAYSGGLNVIGDGKSGVYSKEMVVSANPDIIIISTMGLAGEQEKNGWMRFDSINAVKKDKIFVYESSKICSPSPVELPSTISEFAGLFFPSYKEKIRLCVIDSENEK